MFKMLILTATLFSPVTFAACPEGNASSGRHTVTKNDGFDGCANIGGNCNANIPCCGTASCVRGRCEEVPESLLETLRLYSAR